MTAIDEVYRFFISEMMAIAEGLSADEPMINIELQSVNQRNCLGFHICDASGERIYIATLILRNSPYNSRVELATINHGNLDDLRDLTNIKSWLPYEKDQFSVQDYFNESVAMLQVDYWH